MERHLEALPGNDSGRSQGGQRWREDQLQRDRGDQSPTGGPVVIQLQRTRSGKVLLGVIALIIISFGIGALRVNAQAQAINEQQATINRLIDEQSPLIFAFENTGTSGRLTFE